MNGHNKKILLNQAAFWAAYDGLTAVFLSAFALALGASNTTIGFIGSIPFIALLLTQIPGVQLSQTIARRKLYAVLASASRLCWIGILLAPFITTHPLPVIIVSYLFCRLFVGLSSPAFNTLLADCIEKKHRGAFLSQRFRLVGLFGAVTVLLGGYWLDLFPETSTTGFVIMFGIGILLGLVSTIPINWLREPSYRDHDHHTIREFFTLTGDFKKFIRFSVFFSFAFNISSPLFIVYILKTLNVGYHWYAIVAATTTLAKIVSSKQIGLLTDTYGDKPVTILGVLGTAFVPFFYLFIQPAWVWAVIPISLFAGISWAAADIGKLKYLFDLTDPRREGLQIAEYNFYTAIPLSIAPLLGGIISEHVTFLISGIPLVFALSALLRAASALLLFGIKEPRKKEYSALFVLKHALHIETHKGLDHTLHPLRKTYKQ